MFITCKVRDFWATEERIHQSETLVSCREELLLSGAMNLDFRNQSLRYLCSQPILLHFSPCVRYHLVLRLQNSIYKGHYDQVVYPPSNLRNSSSPPQTNQGGCINKEAVSPRLGILIMTRKTRYNSISRLWGNNHIFTDATKDKSRDRPSVQTTTVAQYNIEEPYLDISTP